MLVEEEKSEEKVDYEPSEERDVEEIDSGGGGGGVGMIINMPRS